MRLYFSATMVTKVLINYDFRTACHTGGACVVLQNLHIAAVNRVIITLFKIFALFFGKSHNTVAFRTVCMIGNAERDNRNKEKRENRTFLT